jgi:REP element-mobilizing transposase RayT
LGRSRYRIIQNEEPYFLTCTIVNWIPLFADPPIVKIVLDSLDYLQKSGRVQVYAYVIMENHLHLVASAKNLSKELGDFKSFTARKIIDYLQETHSEQILRELKLHKVPHKVDRTYQVWQEGSHPEIIQSVEMLRQKIEYIHLNPVRRGYVDDPSDWRCSSARNYAGKDSVLDICIGWD